MFFRNLFKKKAESEVTNDVNSMSEISAPSVELHCLSMPDNPEPKNYYCECCKKVLTHKDNRTNKTNHSICFTCYSKLDKFTIISSQTYLAPCAAAEASETLLIVVLDKCFLLQYCVVANGGYDNFLEIPFGFFASSSSATIADKLNSISFRGNGFGIRESRKLTEKDILDNKEIERLIEFDKTKTADT